ncbi:MAG TPA: nicotinate (nicotinamide) nucleotide adenylyltransferase [Candidatus Paceibacterota bacterium]|uniref:Probable nicotinate-nucleotide adenylyltransferase n=1 Tax=Candidatus Harrisonbacteria bacterium RIFCSPLOWO2_01_FULL_44_18 TaxID=1798407 RepID=A0A1G1ZR29_9BACT|nr:MAG: nicotinate (nicotinamide) nucleotide adenylyltransferase [Candidatus Harrisonbacteria bacterium RIFCSPLOWO2_01_FULL_44_18]
MQTKKKVVIYGGTFNPPHIGHAAAIETVTRLFSCDEIWLMPTADRRDKTVGTAGGHRLKMLEIMIDELFPTAKTFIKISRMELERPRLTTTYETKLELEAAYPSYKFYFLIGSDIVGDIEKKWVNGDELFRTARFIIMKRPLDVLPERLPPQITILDKGFKYVDISSTFIRALLAKGHSGAPYLISGVAEYIKNNGLYR